MLEMFLKFLKSSIKLTFGIETENLFRQKNTKFKTKSAG
jgi:hypothetical protein